MLYLGCVRKVVVMFFWADIGDWVKIFKKI